MKNGIKKAVALGLTGVMMLLAAGCGKSEKVNADNRKEFYYVPSYQDFPIEVDYISNIAATGDDIYLYGSSWNEETEESSGSMYHYQISEGKLQEMPVDLSENSSIQQMKINQAGNLFLIVNTYEKVSTDAETEDSDTSEESPDTSEESTNTLEESTDASEEATEREEGDVEASKKAALEGDGAAETEDEIEYRNQMEMWEISPEDGSLLNVVDLKSAIEDAGDFWVQQMALDGQGNIYLSDGSTAIYVLDASGNRLFSIAVDNWVENLFSAGDGTVYMKTWGSTGLQVKPVDLNAKKLGEAVKCEAISGNNAYNQEFYQGEGNELLVSDSTGVFTYDLENDKKEELFVWLDIDVNSDDVTGVGYLPDGRIWAMLREYQEQGSEYSLAVMEKTPASEVAVKEEIVYGTMYLDQSLRKNIIDFNKSNEKYRITVKEYSTDDYESGRTRMATDIASGNCPDIIDMSSLDLFQYAGKGILEDLYPYMEKEGIVKTDYMENVFKACEMDGELYAIIPQFYVMTTAAKASKVGEEPGWTLQEMLTFAKDSDAKMLFPYASRNTIFQYCIYYNIDEFIDWETGECRFNGDEFIGVLEFANQFPEEWSGDDGEAEGIAERFRADKILLMQTSISSVQEYQMLSGLFGEKVTYIGYPDSERKGNLIQPATGSIAISAKSENKEGAWEFVKILLSEEYQNGLVSEYGSGWSFPAKKSALEKQFENDMTQEYYEDENGQKVKQVKTSWGYDDFNIDIYAASEEEIEAVREIIASAEKLSGYTNQELTKIISEETEAFFKGQKSAKDTADIIQNRVQIYVNENR